MSNNPPYKVVEFSKEAYDLLVENADCSIQQGLAILQSGMFDNKRDKLEKTVKMIEAFRKAREELRKGI